MNWLFKWIKKILNRKKIKLIEETKVIINQEKDKNEFTYMLKRTANSEYDDMNGYGIIKRIELKDMT